jgi:hypothetical protein
LKCVQLAGTEGTADAALGPILLAPCTPDETISGPSIHPRPQRLTKRPAMYVSPFKGDPQRAEAPKTKAHVVRKKFHDGMKCERYFYEPYYEMFIAPFKHLLPIPSITVIFSSTTIRGNSTDQLY